MIFAYGLFVKESYGFSSPYKGFLDKKVEIKLYDSQEEAEEALEKEYDALYEMRNEKSPIVESYGLFGILKTKRYDYKYSPEERAMLSSMFKQNKIYVSKVKIAEIRDAK